jgi:hypothetical protein
MESQGTPENNPATTKVDAAQAELSRLRDAYLSIVEKCLTGLIYEDKASPSFGGGVFDRAVREVGRDWPSMAHTMIGVRRLANVRMLVERIIEGNVPGDLIETGVWRGGACIMMRAVLNAYGVKDRRVWVADSFSGLPEPDSEKYPADTDAVFHSYPELSVSLEAVRHNIENYSLLDDQVCFIKGWFRDTLLSAPVERLAVLRLDGDLYESTIIALNAFYDKVSAGGYVIIDDYHVVPPCKAAIHDFWKSRHMPPEFHEIDGVGIYWQKH